MSDFTKKYREILEEMGLEPFSQENLAEDFEVLTKLLVETNAHTNLTAIRTEEEIIKKHYGDCLYIEKWIEERSSLLDVGCGGGFPSLPLAIARRDLQITSLDSTAKKLKFVEKCSEKMKLQVKTLCGRAEELSRMTKYREQFSYVTARAVASLPILAEWCLPFVKVGGFFIAMKGMNGMEELKSAENAIALLGGKVKDTEVLRYNEGTRVNILIEKVKSTPEKYPRQNNLIFKKPL